MKAEGRVQKFVRAILGRPTLTAQTCDVALDTAIRALDDAVKAQQVTVTHLRKTTRIAVRKNGVHPPAEAPPRADR
jgi:hypothetical protein